MITDPRQNPRPHEVQAESRNTQAGTCWQSPDRAWRYIPIAKCAHTQLVRWCQSQQWTCTTANDFTGQYLVVLRDPIDRWLSGMTLFYRLQNLTAMHRPLLTHLVSVDMHTEPQASSVTNIPLSRMRALDLGVDLSNRWHALVGGPLLPAQVSAPVDTWLLEWVAQPQNSARLEVFYHRDYWLRYWLMGDTVPASVLQNTTPLM
jgi:hypothetical protein